MNKRIITLGLLVGVLSLNSCVKDNESDVVQAQRQAQTEKLKAEASKLIAEKGMFEAQAKAEEAMAKVREAEAKVAEQKAAYDKALNDLDIAVKTKENEAKLVGAAANLEAQKVALEAQKAALEVQKQATWKALEDLKLQIIQDKDAVAKALAEYQGTKELEAIEVVENKYMKYSVYMEHLANGQSNLIDLEQRLTMAEKNAKIAKAAKETHIENLKIQIEGNKERIETLKQYENFSDNMPGLATARTEAKQELELAQDKKQVLTAKYNLLSNKRNEQQDYLTDLSKRIKKFAFFNAARRLFTTYVNGNQLMTGDYYENTWSHVSEGGEVVGYTVYDVDYLPSLSVELKNVTLDRYDKSIKKKEQDIETKKADRDTKKQDMEAKKAAYEADKTNAALETAYIDAVKVYRQAEQDLKDAEEDVADTKRRKQEFLDRVAVVTNEANRKEVKDFLIELNALTLEFAQVELEKKMQEAKVNELQAKYNDLNSVFTKAENINSLIRGLQEDIVNKEATIADLKDVKDAEAYVKKLKEKIDLQKAAIELLKKRVEAAKKAYEDALAAL